MWWSHTKLVWCQPLYPVQFSVTPCDFAFIKHNIDLFQFRNALGLPPNIKLHGFMTFFPFFPGQADGFLQISMSIGGTLYTAEVNAQRGELVWNDGEVWVKSWSSKSWVSLKHQTSGSHWHLQKGDASVLVMVAVFPQQQHFATGSLAKNSSGAIRCSFNTRFRSKVPVQEALAQKVPVQTPRSRSGRFLYRYWGEVSEGTSAEPRGGIWQVPGAMIW